MINTIVLADEAETLTFAKTLFAVFSEVLKVQDKPWILFLKGDLGAGKTTFVRGLLRGFGYSATVKSPTYTLIESYQIQKISIVHLDLYRLNDPAELLSIGLDDYLNESGIICIEWPEQGRGFLPDPDLKIELRAPSDSIKAGRELTIDLCSDRALVFKEILQ